MLFCVSVLVAAGLVLQADDRSPVDQELRKLAGVYRFDMVEVDGVKRADLPFATNKIIILEDGRFVIMQGAQITHGIMKLDITKTPKQYDSTLTQGPNKGLTFPCIYELDADTFKLCGPYAGGERPREFKTGPGSGLVMQVLKREEQTLQEAVTEVSRKELQGGWERTSRIWNGKPPADDSATKLLLIFDANGQVVVIGDGGFRQANTRIDALADPLTIDFTYTEADLKGQSSLGIARVDGETLTICLAAPGKPRPKDFVSEAGSDTTLATYQRPKAEK